MAKRLRAYGIDTLRLVVIVACSIILLVLLCSRLVLEPSCEIERERAFKAEQLAYRLQQANAQQPASADNDLRLRISQLERQLADEQAKNSAGGFQAALAQSLKDENHRLQSQVIELRAQLQQPVPLLRGGRGEQFGSQLVSPLESLPGRSEPLTEEKLRALASQDAIAVVVITCKRPKYLERAMRSFLKARATFQDKFPIVISQDGNDAAMLQMTSTFVAGGTAYHMRHEHDPNAAAIAQRYKYAGKSAIGYVRIAQHYGWAMGQVFDVFGFNQAIFLEEDMEISPDFFSYFGAMLPLLRQDPMLYCVSAWNDIGYGNLVMDPRAAYRTDFFPGLGWMMERSLWDEVRDRWAVAFWDEFMRRPDVRKDRHCIRPEISRSFTFGEEGTSSGQFFKSHLSKIKLNDELVEWEHENLQFLSSPSSFDRYLTQRMQQARRVDLGDVDMQAQPGVDLRLEYDDKKEYKRFATKFGLMQDEKEGIRRMSYRGCIPIAWSGSRVFLHTRNWPGSDSLP